MTGDQSEIAKAVDRLRKNLEYYDQDAALELANGGERADLWAEIDVSVDDLRTLLSVVEPHNLADEIDPEVGFPSDDLLRRIHLDVETRGRKNPAFEVSVHHRSIVLSAVAHALRKRECTWEEWLEACGWPRGSGGCECYRPGDCDGSCTHHHPDWQPVALTAEAASTIEAAEARATAAESELARLRGELAGGWRVLTDPEITVIREALRFADCAAGEGLCPAEGEPAEEPAEFLSAYSQATGDEDWAGLADRISDRIPAAIEPAPATQETKP